MGARGMRLLLHDKENWIQIPTYPTEAVDPTGAGDAFCGGFLVGMAQTGEPRPGPLSMAQSLPLSSLKTSAYCMP